MQENLEVNTLLPAQLAVLRIYLTYFQSNQSTKDYKKRRGHLATSIFYLSQIHNYRISIKIISNLEISNFQEIARPIESRLDRSSIEQILASEAEVSENGKRLEWLLTWVHKRIMIEDFNSIESNSDDLFLVLEDDALFTEANLQYFLKENKQLEATGLIPGFIRSEWSDLDLSWTHEDPIGRITETSKFFSHPNCESKILMQLVNPFSASIILNYKLAREYFSSDSSIQKLACYKHPVIFDIGSTATLGLIMENIPEGYINRVAVICNSENRFPIPGSVIRHLGDRYSKDKWHRNIRLYDLVDLEELSTHRNLNDYIKRIFKKDGYFVVKKSMLKWIQKIT